MLVNRRVFKYSYVNMGMIVAGFLIYIILLIILTHFQARQTQELEQTFLIYKVKGYVQTPIGGRPGTSDLLRPSLSELGIEQVPISGQTVIQRQRGWNIYTGYEQIRAQGDTKLQKALKTYGRSIPARTPLQTGIKFDWYRVGSAYPILIWWGRWYEIAPAIELVLLDFGYRFKTPLLISGRAYRHVGVRVGVTMKHYLDDQPVTLTHFFSLPGLGRLSIFTHNERMGDDYFQLTKIAFKDSQPLPNHLFLEAKTAGKIENNRIVNKEARFLAPWELPKNKTFDW